MATLTLIAAVALNGAIGINNDLLYYLPNDLKHFKTLTMGHTIIMGRRTYESLPKGALPHRRNIVLSKTLIRGEGYEVCSSLQEALDLCQQDDEIFVIGGAAVYAAALPWADKLYLTHIDDIPMVADVFFPQLDMSNWKCVAREAHPADEHHAYAYTFATYYKNND